MLPGQRRYNTPSPPIDILDRRRQARTIKLGPFHAGTIELPGTELLNLAGKAGVQMGPIATLYKQRPADETIIIIDFVEVNTQADFEFPQGNEDLRDHYPTRLLIKRGIEEPLLSRGETGQGLVKLVLERPTLILKCLERRTAVEKTVAATALHVALRADGEILIAQ